MGDLIADVRRAAAELRRTAPKALHVWVTDAIRDHHHAAQADLPDRTLLFVSPKAIRETEQRVAMIPQPSWDFAPTICVCPLRDFDRLPRDVRLTIALEVEAVSPVLAAILATTGGRP